LPTGSTYESESGFSWIPSASQVGEYEVRFTASDPHGVKSELAVAVNVLANVAPTLAALGQADILAGESVNVQLEAADADDDKSALAYSLNNAPDGMQVSETGLVTWATQAGVHSGEYTAEAVVSDPLGASASQQLKVVVNGAPMVEAIDALTVMFGEMVAFTVAASDPEGGNLTFKALNNPDGFKGSSPNGFKGQFSWTTKGAVAGDYKLDIEVADDVGLKSVVSVQVTLKANLAPTVEPVEPIAVKVGGDVGFNISASDPEGGKLTYKALNNPDGFKRKIRNGYNGVFLWYTTKASAGNYKIDIEVSDVDGLKTIIEVQVTLEEETGPALLSAPAVVGPFVTEAEAVIDEAKRTVTLAKSAGMRFFKLQSGDNTKLKITSIAIEGDNVVMSYTPAGE